MRRRGGAGGGSMSDDAGLASPTLSAGSTNGDAGTRAHAGSALEGGSKIAYDPRDLEDDGAREGGRPPRLTILEEVLLLGLKDKQVSLCLKLLWCAWRWVAVRSAFGVRGGARHGAARDDALSTSNLRLVMLRKLTNELWHIRDTSPFGTTTSHMPFAGASSSNSRSAGASRW